MNVRIQSGGWTPSPNKVGEWLRTPETSLCHGDIVLSAEGWTFNGPDLPSDPSRFPANDTAKPDPWTETKP